MNTTAGILAGLLVAGAAVALYRFAHRTVGGLRTAIDELRGAPNDAKGGVIDFEQDPATGVYRKKP